MTSPRRSENKVDLPAPLGPTNPIRSPRLTWSETSSNSARPAKDFESCETVSITESAQCSLVRCPAQLVNHESTRMDTNHEMNPSVSGEHRPLACWRWLPAVAHFTAMLLVTDVVTGAKPSESNPQRRFFSDHLFDEPK